MTTALGSASQGRTAEDARRIVESRTKNRISISTTVCEDDTLLRIFAAAMLSPHLRSPDGAVADSEAKLVCDLIESVIGRGLAPGKLDWVVSNIAEMGNGMPRLTRLAGFELKLAFRASVAEAPERDVLATLTSTANGQTLTLEGLEEDLRPICRRDLASAEIWIFSDSPCNFDRVLTRSTSVAAHNRNRDDHG